MTNRPSPAAMRRQPSRSRERPSSPRARRGRASARQPSSRRKTDGAAAINLKSLAALPRRVKVLSLIGLSFFGLWLLLKVFAAVDLWPLLAFPILMSGWFFFEAGVVASMVLTATLLLQARPDNTGPVMTAFFAFGVIGIAMAGALRRRSHAHGQMLKMSLTDALTGLYNYGYLLKALDREMHRANRYGGELTLVMFDIDHFKMFNDRFGHQAGNRALQGVADVIRREKRESDIAARFGGEEFVLIIPGDEAAGADTAQRLRRQIAALEVPVGGGATAALTVSVGVAGYPQAASSREELLERVDQLLYSSKKKGRNCVTLSSRGRRIVSLEEPRTAAAQTR